MKVKFLTVLLFAGCSTIATPTDPSRGPIVLEVWKNRELLTIAGAEDMGVLNVIVDALGPLGKDSFSQCKEQCSEEKNLLLSAGGLTSRKDPATDEFKYWIQQDKLKVGDVIEIRIRDDIQPYPAKIKRNKADALKAIGKDKK